MSRRYLTVMAIVLSLIGAVLFLHKAFALGFPMRPGDAVQRWDLEARLHFIAEDGLVKIALGVPSSTRRALLVDEQFTSRGFGLTMKRTETGREVVWSRRQASGEQVLYYRATVQFVSDSQESRPSSTPPPVSPVALAGVDLAAAQALLDEVRARSTDTETFAALKLFVDNWRWRGVPFYLRTGKRMGETRSLVSIRFKHAPQQLFRETRIQNIEPNWLLLGIQPEQCIRLEVQVRESGLEMRTRSTQLDASSCALPGQPIDAYESLLLDVIEGDRALFLRGDEVRWAWKIMDPVLKTWAMEREYIHPYPAGSWGPPEAERLFERDDQRWRNSLIGE